VLRTRSVAVLFGLLAMGCSFGDTLQPYYKGTAPTVSGLSVDSEQGNIGGEVIQISGSGFGTDAAMVTVIFGSQNASVLAASDSQLEVVVPRGPIEGGFVDVVVGTSSGQMRLEEGYRYDTRLGADEDIFENEVAYIAVTDDYFSCGGGIGNIYAYPDILEAYGWSAGDIRTIRETGEIPWTHEDNEDNLFSPYETFCNEGLTFGGYVGIDGRSEVLEFVYPRLHTLYAGYRNGFGGNFDLSPGEWSVQVPSQDVVSIDIEGFYDDLRTEVDDFVITNVDVMDAVAKDDREFCADLSALVDIRYEPADGDLDSADCPYTGHTTNGPFYLEHPSCEGNAARTYDLAEMKFCQADDYENTRSYRYEAEWPVGEYFFKGTNPDTESEDAPALSMLAPTTIQLDVPEAGISGVQIELPEAAVFLGESGWNTQYFSPQLNNQTKGIYGLLGFEDTCADSDRDGETTAADIAATVEWRPSHVELTEGSDITGARTFIRFTITAAGFGWYGGEGAVMKATITVDDFHNTDYGDEDDPYDDVSTLEIPASVLYQVPSMLQNFGGLTNNSGSDGFDECGAYVPGADIEFEWARSEVVNYGFVITQAERVTEYAVNAPDLGGDLVFAYSSGDIGYTVFGTASDETPSWLNPVDGDSTCGDCSDSDDDGWTDAEDPDCMAADVDGDGIPDEDVNDLQEDGSRFGLYTCNDGIDNDEDGDIDGDDSDCSVATDDEDDCADERDNDNDGYVDAADPDCWVGGVGYENGRSDFECNDGIDNDNDGRVDRREPECTSADQREVNCSDGEDNDGDGLVDDADPECQDPVDQVENFFHDTDTSCNDGIDNDGDGWVDLDDLDCPAAVNEEVGFTDYECNNGVDDDGQGDVDGLDPSCVRDGPSGDESPNFTAGCADGRDNDGDGYVDGNDPDCEYAPFSIERNLYHDPSFYDGVPACYNGVDDDLDAATDAADADCVNAAGEPSGFVLAEDSLRPECSNGQDDDADGWVDASDPDCTSGDTEDGLGAAECNDGVDNDGDTFVDADDSDCDSAEGTESD
jgi:hypothetical protein